MVAALLGLWGGAWFEGWICGWFGLGCKLGF